ncbi:MAG: hypothetical protein K9M81_03035 [Chthoniobacterales bacterium]|nr:hypothetical protein [Chthoniobacterales bacterium]
MSQSITFVDSLAPARLALSGLPPKARAVSPAVSRPQVVSASGFAAPRDEPV